MPSFSVWNHEKNNLFLTISVMFLNIHRIYFSYFSIEKIKSNYYIFFLKFFQSSFSDRNLIPFQLYLFIKGLTFVILCWSFLISSWFIATVTTYWKHLLSFYWYNLLLLFLLFIQPGESINDPQYLDLFHDIYNTMNKYNQGQTDYLSSIFLYYFDIY